MAQTGAVFAELERGLIAKLTVGSARGASLSGMGLESRSVRLGHCCWAVDGQHGRAGVPGAYPGAQSFGRELPQDCYCPRRRGEANETRRVPAFVPGARPILRVTACKVPAWQEAGLSGRHVGSGEVT